MHLLHIPLIYLDCSNATKTFRRLDKRLAQNYSWRNVRPFGKNDGKENNDNITSICKCLIFLIIQIVHFQFYSYSISGQWQRIGKKIKKTEMERIYWNSRAWWSRWKEGGRTPEINNSLANLGQTTRDVQRHGEYGGNTIYCTIFISIVWVIIYFLLIL